LKKIVRLIYNLASFLTQRNIGKIMKYIRLFGLITVYKEVRKKLWSEDTYLINEAPDKSPVINDMEVHRGEDAPKDNVTISVVIPAKNAGDDFLHLLSSLKNQKGFKDIELIVVDSGSTDRSLEIAGEFGAKIIQILPKEFSHSYARNLGAKHACGDYFLFTVQDALPPSDVWLHELFSAIKSHGVVAVSCAELPRTDADLFYRAISWDHYEFLGVDKQDRIMCKPDFENHLTLRRNGQLCDIATLIKGDVFMKYRFRGNYAEDLDLGIRLIRDGFKLALLSSTKIIHSHNRPAYYYLKRGYVDNLSISQILPDRPVLVVDAEKLYHEITFVCGVVNSIVCRDLQKITVPCTPKKLARFVMKRLRTTAKGNCFSNIDIENNVYVDSQFKSFLQSVYNHYDLSGGNNRFYDRKLLDAMQSFMIMFFEYMNDTYELIDNHVLEEFKMCIYQACAFMLGTHLASCFLRGSESTKEEIREIDAELTKGI